MQDKIPKFICYKCKYKHFGEGSICPKCNTDNSLPKIGTINLLMLFFFKYYNFFVGNINDFLGLNIPLHELRMPIGISFFTFQALTYVVDVHRKNVEPQKNYFNLLLYISMFPQLIAGPIVRYADVEKQITNRKETIDGFNYGIENWYKQLLKILNIG